MAVTDIRFRDLVEREDDARGFLHLEQNRLKDKLAKLGLTQSEQQDLDRINSLLLSPDTELLDPLFVAVRDAFNDSITLLNRTLLNHSDGVLKMRLAHGAAETALTTRGGVVPKRDRTTDPTKTPEEILTALETSRGAGDEADDVVRVAHVLGILAEKGIQPPRVVKLEHPNSAGSSVGSDTKDKRYEGFMSAFFEAFGQSRGVLALARLVLPILQVEGDRDGSGGRPGEVKTTEFAAVLSCLRSKGVTDDEPQLRRRINQCLNKIQEVDAPASVADLSISLPDLNEVTAYQIQAENVEAFGPMICGAMFDELKAFEVVDKLVELWQQGTLPIGVGTAGKRLYQYWKDTPNRMSEGERRNFYAITMGIPGGQANGSANRDFNDLWMRFVSSVSTLVRQKTADQILRSNLPSAVGQQQVKKAARDLASNLSLHGYGMVNYAARDLQDQIVNIIGLLGDSDIMNAYGAKDMWQVIDQVASVELGGARNSARYRTLATCGAIITKWLSQNVKKFNSASPITRVIDVDQIFASDPPTAGPDATKHPTDYDLVNACELWLADTAVSDERIDEVARQPRETPAMTSRPVQIPSIARELLDQALPPGLGLGMSLRR